MDFLFMTILGVAVAVFAVAMVYAAVSDLCRFEIPNWVSAVVCLAFLAGALASSLPWPVLLTHVAAAAGVLVVGFALFAFGWLGAGDVKLLTANALWMGWPLLLQYLVLMVLAGGVLSLLLILFRRIPLYRGFTRIGWIARLHARKKDVPYGVAIALSALVFLDRMPIGLAQLLQ